jgi:hypothetical protein
MYFLSEFNAIIHREIQNQPAPLYMNDWASAIVIFLLMNFRILPKCNGKT